MNCTLTRSAIGQEAQLSVHTCETPDEQRADMCGCEARAAMKLAIERIVVGGGLQPVRVPGLRTLGRCEAAESLSMLRRDTR